MGRLMPILFHHQSHIDGGTKIKLRFPMPQARTRERRGFEPNLATRRAFPCAWLALTAEPFRPESERVRVVSSALSR
jgi:hypothetical protein